MIHGYACLFCHLLSCLLVVILVYSREDQSLGSSLYNVPPSGTIVTQSDGSGLGNA